MDRKKITVAISFLVAGIAIVGIVAVHVMMTAKAEKEKKIAARKELHNSYGIASDGTKEFIPLPQMLPHNLGAMRIGNDLFHDSRFFRTPYRTCAVCHDVSKGGTDEVVRRKVLTRPLCNAVLANYFLHDGSVSNINDVVKLMLEDSRFGAGGPLEERIKKLSSDVALVKRFQAVFPDTGFTPSNVVNAIVNYQRTLFTPSGKFDLYCDGNANALSQKELKGFEVFKQQNCTKCHDGLALGGMKVCDGKNVPRLRGLALRKKYMHDGSLSDLGAVLQFMPTEKMTRQNRTDLIKFLKCL